MNKTKQYIFSTILFFLFGLIPNVFSQEVVILTENNTDTIVPTVYTIEFNLKKIEYNTGDTVEGYFVLSNKNTYNIPDIKYTISLGGSYNGSNPFPYGIYDTMVSDKVFLGSLENKKIDFKYKLSDSYAGDNFGIHLNILTGAGLSLSIQERRIKIKGVSKELGIIEKYIKSDDTIFHIQEGPSVRENNKIFFHTKIFNNLGKVVKAYPLLDIYNRTVVGQKVKTINFDPIVLNKEEKKDFDIDLRKIISTPGVYEGVFKLVDENNNSVSENILFRYIVYGNIVTIHNVIPDKTVVEKGKPFNIKINYTGSPVDITIGEKPAQVPMYTEIYISNTEGDAMSSYKGDIDYSVGNSINIPMLSLLDSQIYGVFVKVFDKDKKVLASYQNNVSVIKDKIDFETEKFNYFPYLIGFLSLLILIVFVSLFYKINKKI